MAHDDMTYKEALHAMQSGIAVEIAGEVRGPENLLRHLKHVRVGINSAMITQAAIVRLLEAKGIITQAEILEELRLEAIREVRRYEDRLSQLYNKTITLG